MSRRNYKKLEQQPLPPFAENLVFWAPLTEDDLTDHITGVTGSPLNATIDNMVWDNNVGAYRIYVTSLYQNALVFPITDFQSRFGNGNSITYSLYIRKRTSVIYHFTNGYAKSGDNKIYDYGYPVAHLNSYQNQISSSQFDKFTFVFNGDNLTSDLYKNNNVISHSVLQYNSIHLPHNWKMHFWDNITIAGVLGGDFKTDAYFKECKIFNKALTAQEVAQL